MKIIIRALIIVCLVIVVYLSCIGNRDDAIMFLLYAIFFNQSSD